MEDRNNGTAPILSSAIFPLSPRANLPYTRIENDRGAHLATDQVRKLIVERLNALGLNRNEVSIAIGRNPTYLHQFLHRGVPAELHERERIKLAEILKVAEPELRGPITQSDYAETLASTRLEKDPAKDSSPVTKDWPVSARQLGNADLPVYGRGHPGLHGNYSVTKRPVTWVERPPMLARVEDAYALIVMSDAMAPEHKPGSVALINPHLPPRIGDSCVFRCVAEDGTTHAIFREYRGESETHWRVRQHNPPKDSTLKKAEWPECHRTVGSYFAA